MRLSPSFIKFKSLNFIYFTTITKQVIQLLLIMLVGTDVCVRMVFVWEGHISKARWWYLGQFVNKSGGFWRSKCRWSIWYLATRIGSRIYILPCQQHRQTSRDETCIHSARRSSDHLVKVSSSNTAFWRFSAQYLIPNRLVSLQMIRWHKKRGMETHFDNKTRVA